MVECRRQPCAALAVFHFLIAATVAFGTDDSPDPNVGADYVGDVKPILRNLCWSCHGPVKQESDLRLDTGKAIHAAEVVVPGRSVASEMIRRVTSGDEEVRMPPEGRRLTQNEIRVLRAWIDEGAKHPDDETAGSGPDEHWSFQPIQRPPIPAVRDGDWPLTPIDHFVLARLEARAWRPNPQSSATNLLRRAYLDLIGLPPTIDEQERFAADPDFPALVQELLDRKGYGERYARHWLDVVRYADSNGYERDGAKPEVWRYRDFVIRALNVDKPFNRFVLEQVAGDELPDATTETVIATGFHRLGPFDDEPADFAVDRFDQLDDVVNTTSQAFLGLTMGCARCHDHKFDPLAQADYYSLVAIFNPLVRPTSGRSDLSSYAAPPALAKRLKERDAAIDKELAGRRAKLEEWAIARIRAGASQLAEDVRTALLAGDDRDKDQTKLVTAKWSDIEADVEPSLNDEQKSQLATHDEAIAALKQQTPDVAQGYFFLERSPVAPETRLLKRGNPRTPGDVVQPAVPAVLVRRQPDFPPSTDFTTQRRLTLARWLVDPDNPLTARVMVNRVWQWHFGYGLVTTPNDFGLIGQRPTHPRLLDWLAHWFVHDADWSLKKLHTLIMTSRVYQMSSHSRKDLFNNDPDNRLLWRYVPHRVEVEVIRDSMLSVSGRLDRTMFGPATYPFIPKEALLNHADKTTIWPAFDEAAASRRTVYAYIKRSLVIPFLEVLDLCDVTQTSPQRKVTTVPTQALTLFNGEFAMRQSRHFADRVLREGGGTTGEQIRFAVRVALARDPSGDERAAMEGFLAVQKTELRSRRPKSEEKLIVRAAMTQLCRVIFNLNEFVYPQ